MQIIAHNPISTPLLTNPKPNHDEDPPLVARRTPHLTPASLLGRKFEFNRSYDLAELKLYDFIFAVAICVVVG